LWVADITFVATWAGWLYLAVVVDALSRRVVGWAMSTQLHTTLVLDALHMAIQQRRPQGVIHHSDQGSQYTSLAFGQRCRDAGVRPSMGSSEIATTMLSARASLPLSNANCSTAIPSTPRRKHAWLSLPSSKAGTIRIDDTQPSTISHPIGTKPFMLIPHKPASPHVSTETG